MAKKAKSASKSTPRRRAKTKADAPGASALQSAAVPGMGDNSKNRVRTADEVRANFVHHRERWLEWRGKRKLVDEFERNMKAKLKADGFKVMQFRIADQLSDPKGDERVQAEVRDRLQVARWIGHPMGRQLDLFEQPDRTPSVDVAYDDGKTAGLEGLPRKPPYSPDVPQHDSWMNGWYDGQKLHMKRGFKQKEGAVASSEQPQIDEATEPAGSA